MKFFTLLLVMIACIFGPTFTAVACDQVQVQPQILTQRAYVQPQVILQPQFVPAFYPQIQQVRVVQPRAQFAFAPQVVINERRGLFGQRENTTVINGNGQVARIRH